MSSTAIHTSQWLASSRSFEMSAGPSSLGEALAKQITLYVLSPSTEVPNRLTFPDTPVSTTIGELKQKIQEIVATKPAPERQRLIYRARPLVQDSATLEDVFGREAVRKRTENYPRAITDEC